MKDPSRKGTTSLEKMHFPKVLTSKKKKTTGRNGRSQCILYLEVPLYCIAKGISYAGGFPSLFAGVHHEF